ncbi:helix-turn-helix domain-containing protein [Acidithiobacillus ferrivorans]|nr:helix-turn-helix domain-containing protein [Acidithiobacillus ferrivorans]
MDLISYLRSTTQVALARKLGVTQGTVWQLSNGRIRMSADWADRIHKATNGAVTREELRPDIFGPNPQAQSITGQDHRVAERRSTNRRVTTRRRLSPGTNT